MKRRRPSGVRTEMFYFLVYHVPPRAAHLLNVLRYITVRTALASLSALFLGLLLGPWMVRRLRAMQIGQFIREEGPRSHQAKAGTPTMGGILIVADHADPHAHLGRPQQSQRSAGLLRHAGFRRRRIRRRLQQSDAPAQPGPHRPVEILSADCGESYRRPGAVDDDGVRRLLGSIDRAVFQEISSRAGFSRRSEQPLSLAAGLPAVSYSSWCW